LSDTGRDARSFDEVFDTQTAFRALLMAMARPGRIEWLPWPVTEVPAGLSEAYALTLMTLLDHEVSFCLAGTGDSGGEVEKWVVMRTGCKPAAPEEADFILVLEGDSKRCLSRAKQGTPEFPDRGATAVYQVAGLRSGQTSGTESGMTVRLMGPGVDGSRCITVYGLGSGEMDDIRSTRRDYPVGVDVILVSRQGEVACLPRSTLVTFLDEA